MKAFLFCMILLFYVQSIWGQKKSSEENSADVSLVEQNVSDYKDYESFTNFQSKTPEDSDYEIYYYNWFKNNLQRIEKDLMKFFFSQLKFNYDKKKKKYQKNSIFFFQNDFFADLNLGNSNLIYILRERLKKINDVYKRFYKGFFSIGVSEIELENAIMKGKVLESLILYSIGGEKSLEEAIANFEFLIGSNVDKIRYVKSNKNKKDVYRYLIALYKQIGKYYVRRVDKIKRDRSLLYYRWKLALLVNTKNKLLRDYKLEQLIKEFYPSMDMSSLNFKNYKDTVLKVYENTNDSRLKAKLMDKFGAKFFDPNMELD